MNKNKKNYWLTRATQLDDLESCPASRTPWWRAYAHGADEEVGLDGRPREEASILRTAPFPGK